MDLSVAMRLHAISSADRIIDVDILLSLTIMVIDGFGLATKAICQVVNVEDLRSFALLFS